MRQHLAQALSPRKRRLSQPPFQNKNGYFISVFYATLTLRGFHPYKEPEAPTLAGMSDSPRFSMPLARDTCPSRVAPLEAYTMAIYRKGSGLSAGT
ncbi:MAG: hypothetical protein IPK82_22825 [Polyangiaceae bacterium]|nr:hypothetical protein [Polyangiaceae bacterium]